MNSQTTQNSPLSEAKPRSLDDLFQADPDHLTDDDIARMVEELRLNRAHFKREKQLKVSKAVIPTGTLDEMMEILDLKGKMK
jgi:hypothetical protein